MPPRRNAWPGADLRCLLAKNLDAAAHEASTSPLNLRPAPTEGQLSAGNYKKGRVRFAGLDLCVENPAGSYRKPEWPPMQAHYGYVRGTHGADGDAVDVFVRPSSPLDWDGCAYVVDQSRADGSFDEHKVMLGYDSQEQATMAYLAHYPKGWTMGQVTAVPLAEFKQWLKGGDTASPVAKNEIPRRRVRLKPRGEER